MCEHNNPKDLSNLANQERKRRVGGVKIVGQCTVCGERNEFLLSKVL